MPDPIRFKFSQDNGKEAKSPDELQAELDELKRRLTILKDYLEKATGKLLKIRDTIDNGDNDDCLSGQLRLAKLANIMVDPSEVNEILQKVRNGINDAIADMVDGQKQSG